MIGILGVDDDLEMERYASAQVREFSHETEIRTVDQPLNVPGELSRMLEELEAVLVAVDVTETAYEGEIVREIIAAERESGKAVQKAIVRRRNNENLHDFERRAQELAREKAELLVEDITG